MDRWKDNCAAVLDWIQKSKYNQIFSFGHILNMDFHT